MKEELNIMNEKIGIKTFKTSLKLSKFTFIFIVFNNSRVNNHTYRAQNMQQVELFVSTLYHLEVCICYNLGNLGLVEVWDFLCASLFEVLHDLHNELLNIISIQNEILSQILDVRISSTAFDL